MQSLRKDNLEETFSMIYAMGSANVVNNGHVGTSHFILFKGVICPLEVRNRGYRNISHYSEIISIELSCIMKFHLLRSAILSILKGLSALLEVGNTILGIPKLIYRVFLTLLRVSYIMKSHLCIVCVACSNLNVGMSSLRWTF